MIGNCHLCGENRKLAESHIIPKFVFKWMKESGGKYFRNPLNPNQRLQDGIKRHLLCNDCELNFSKKEKWFAENIFYPHINQKAQFIEYDNNLAKFIISVLWRYLLICKVDGKVFCEDVYYDWKSFLINDSKLKYDKIHLVFLSDEWGQDGQPNIYVNRYFNRVSDISVIENSNTKIIYAKFARFIVCVDINGTDNYFRGTEISLDKGRFPFAQFIADKNIAAYFINRAEQIYNLTFERISIIEKEKIENEVLKNSVEFFKSDLGKIVSKDFDNKIVPLVFKKEYAYVCDCCLKLLEEPEGFLLRTYEIIQSAEYWKFAFRRNNLTINDEDLNKRMEYFMSMASSVTPWVICDNCIDKFKIDLGINKALMNEWISKKGKFFPPQCDDFRKYISKEKLDKIVHIIVTEE